MSVVELAAAIMNLPLPKFDDCGHEYILGFRDARCAAAELLLANMIEPRPNVQDMEEARLELESRNEAGEAMEPK